MIYLRNFMKLCELSAFPLHFIKHVPNWFRGKSGIEYVI